MAPTDEEPQAWHQALAYALLGRRLVDLGWQQTPDLEALAERLGGEVGREALAVQVDALVRAGQVWPHPVPADLMVGIGFAQFASALRFLQSRLGLDLAERAAPRVGRSQPPDATERRLREDVPPHHGG